MDLDFILLAALLPVVFMVHDFEEIIAFKPWIEKNRAYLAKRFPLIAKKMLPRFEKLSTSAYTVAVAEEFIILSAITFFSIYFEHYYWWFAAFMGFSIHLIVHIVQFIVIRRYVPVIVTSILALPYCIYTFCELINKNLFTATEMTVWTLTGVVLVAVNLLLAHRLAAVFNRFIGK